MVPDTPGPDTNTPLPGSTPEPASHLRPVRPRRGPLRLVVLVLSGSLLLGCIACLGLGLLNALVGSRATPTPSRQGLRLTPAGAAATPTARPPVAPTTTPVEPTPPPPPPTPTVPLLTADERAYLSTIGSQTTRLAEMLDRLATQLQSPDIGSLDWLLTTGDYIVQMQGIIEEAQNTPVPPGLSNINTLYERALGHFDRATTLLLQGVDAGDAALLQQAGSELTQGQAVIDQVVEEMRKFDDSH